MRPKMIGLIGLVWGAGIILYGLLGHSTAHGNAAYSAGNYAAVFFGAVIFAAGLVAVRRAFAPSV